MNQSFDTAMQPLAKPKPAPEPATYGLIFVGLCVAFVWFKRFAIRKP